MRCIHRKLAGIYYFEVPVKHGWRTVAVSESEARSAYILDAVLIDSADLEARACYLAEHKANLWDEPTSTYRDGDETA